MKRDILKKSTIGAMYTGRSESNVSPGSNQAYGVDAAFGFFENLTVGGYWARTHTEGLAGDDDSFQGRFDYFADRYGARFEYLDVGDDFNPEVGFVQRDNFRRGFASLRFSPRPKNLKGVRKLTWQADYEYLENGQGAPETRVGVGKFNIELENSDTVNVEATRDYELLLQPFQVAPGVIIPTWQLLVRRRAGELHAGRAAPRRRDHRHADRRVLGRHHPVAELHRGPRLGAEAVLARADGAVHPRRAARRATSRPRCCAPAPTTPSRRGCSPARWCNTTPPTRRFSTNVRYRWEYKLGSEFFVVYTDERDTTFEGYPGPQEPRVRGQGHPLLPLVTGPDPFPL